MSLSFSFFIVRLRLCTFLCDGSRVKATKRLDDATSAEEMKDVVIERER